MRPEPAEPGLGDYLAILRQRRRIIIVTVLVAVAVALVVSLLQTPRYRAQSELLLGRTTNESLMADELNQFRSSADAERELNNEIRLIESSSVRDAVEDQYDGPLRVADVQASADASESNDIIELSLESTEPSAAADLVNLYAETYIQVRRERNLEELLAASEEIQTRLDGIREEIAEVSEPLDEINARVATAPPESARRTELEDERQGVMAQVLPQLAPLQSRESAFRGQLEQLQVSEDLTRSGGVEVLDAATPPASPVSPDVVANVVMAGLLGLVAGIALAFVADRLDDSVRSKDVMEHLTSVPTLGVIPARGAGQSGDLVTLQDPTSPAAEAYRLLRTSVRFIGLDAPMKTLLVTSAAATEGKTVTAANLAVTLAQSGDRVLLIGADLRRPRIHTLFGAPQSPGLTSVLLGEVTAESTVYAIREAPGLHVMPPGPEPPSPAELLDSARARELLAALTTSYDRIVIDSPPVLPVTDAQVLSRASDAVLMVVAHAKTSKRGLARAVELLDQVDAPLIGTVLDRVAPSQGYGGHAYRYSSYTSRHQDEPASRAEAEATATPAHAPPASGNGGVPVPDAGHRATGPTP